MPELERVPTDVAGDDLVGIYRQAARRLSAILHGYLSRGIDPDRVGTDRQRRGDATAAYRTRQLLQVQQLLAELERAGHAGAGVATRRAYEATLIALERLEVRDGAGARGAWGGVHRRAIDALAANLDRSLSAAAARTRANVEAVFARAAMLEGPLPAEGLAGVRFLGRRHDDPWRRLALETVAVGTAALDTRRQISRELARRLIREGVTDALTGFVDRAGRRWPLDVYAEMVVRTTTREATSRATVSRLLEVGDDLVAISTHPHVPDECSPYDGNTYSLGGGDPRHEKLPELPPFHPRCRHVIAPAAASLDDFERELERAAGELAAPPSAPAEQAPAGLLEPPGPPDPPFSAEAEPSYDAATAERLEAQRVAKLIAGDPGPQPGYLDALEAVIVTDERRAVRALNKTLGPELAKELRRKWAVEAGWRGRLLRGEDTVSDFEEEAYTRLREAEERRYRREYLAGANGELRTRPINCFVCGRWKQRPADVCDYCGDDPVTYGGSAESFNRNFGYAS